MSESITEAKKSVSSLAFAVYPHGDNLFSVKMMKFRDGKLLEWKHGTGTSLGHAIAMSQELLGAYALYAHEIDAQKFYDEAVIL